MSRRANKVNRAKSKPRIPKGKLPGDVTMPKSFVLRSSVNGVTKTERPMGSTV